jgi:hypothetical protein
MRSFINFFPWEAAHVSLFYSIFLKTVISLEVSVLSINVLLLTFFKMVDYSKWHKMNYDSDEETPKLSPKTFVKPSESGKTDSNDKKKGDPGGKSPKSAEVPFSKDGCEDRSVLRMIPPRYLEARPGCLQGVVVAGCQVFDSWIPLNPSEEEGVTGKKPLPVFQFEPVPLAQSVGIPLVQCRLKECRPYFRDSMYTAVRMMIDPKSGFAPRDWLVYGSNEANPAPSVMICRSDGIPFNASDWCVYDDYVCRVLEEFGENEPPVIDRDHWKRYVRNEDRRPNATIVREVVHNETFPPKVYEPSSI